MNGKPDENIAGAGEFAVGFGSEADPWIREDASREVDLALQEIRQHLANVRSTTNQILDACWQECRGPAEQCEACLSGGLDNDIVSLVQLRNSIRGKIESRLDSSLSEVTGQLVSLFEKLPADNTPIEAPKVSELLSPKELSELSAPPQSPESMSSEREPIIRPPVIIGDATNIFTMPDGTVELISTPDPLTPFPPGQGGQPTIGFPGPTPTITPGGGGGSECKAQLVYGADYYSETNAPCLAPPGQSAFGSGPIAKDECISQIIGGTRPGEGKFIFTSKVVCPPDGGPPPPDDDTICTGPSCSNVPDPCALPAGHSWIDADDHSKGYKNDATGAITATPDCVSSGKCPTCAPEKLPPKLLGTGTTAGNDPPPKPEFPLGCDPAKQKEFDESPEVDSQIDAIVAFAGSEFKSNADKMYQSAKDASILSKGILYVIGFLWGNVNLVFGMVGSVSSSIWPAPKGCDAAKFKAAVRMMGFVDVASKFFIFTPEHIRASLIQRMNYACQYLIPSPPNLDQMRLRKQITEKEWEYGLKLNGVCLDWARKNYKAVTEFVVPPADLVRFMQRDVFDPASVETLGLLTDFDKKFTGKALEIAEKQGVSKESMQQYWAAHWDNLPPTQIFQMMQRLAPDMGAKAPDGTPVSMTPAKAKELLQIADKPPALINELMAISYLPINRTDAKTLYVTGVIDKQELTKIIRQAGLTKEDAEKSATGFSKMWAGDRARFQGAPALAELDRIYRGGGLQEDQYKKTLENYGLEPDQINSRVANQNAVRAAADRTAVSARIRSAYLHGRLDDLEYRSELSAAGFTVERVNEIISRDSQIKRVSNKLIPIRSMCKLVAQGYLSMDDYIRRAMNLGFNQTDAALMAQSCNADIVAKRQAQIETEQRRALQAAEKAQRQLERQKALERKRYREQFPCKPKPKPTCPDGVSPPPARDDVGFSG